MNGSKRFVVAMSHPEKNGVFARTGVIFYLEDLKEVSEETGDQIKYICNHKVTGRVRIEEVLNPEVWDSRETYLKVKGTILEEDVDDDDSVESKKDALDEQIADNDIYKQLVGAINPNKNKNNPPPSIPEKDLNKAFQSLVHKQHELEEDVRFTISSITSLATQPGNGESSLWMTIRLWQSFIEQRLVGRQNEMQMEFQEKLLDFLKKEKGLKENELPSAIGFEDLSPALQQEVQDLQKRMSVELRPLVLESTLAIQKILEVDGHEERCKVLKYFMDAERMRLDAKKQLKGMFGSDDDGVNVGVENEDSAAGEKTKTVEDKAVEGVMASAKSAGIMMEEVEFEDEDEDDEDEEDDGSSSQSGALLVDEPDAFQ